MKRLLPAIIVYLFSSICSSAQILTPKHTSAPGGDKEFQYLVNNFYDMYGRLGNYNAMFQASNVVVQKDKLKRIISKLEDSIANNGLKLTKQLNTINGGRSVKVNGINYTFFVADLSKNEIKLNLINPTSGTHFHSLGNVKDYWEKQGREPLMITNGGMFNPTNNPQGMYIDEAKNVSFPLDELIDGKGNFYYQPNGVFFIDTKNRAHVDSTLDVSRKIRNRQFDVKMATQSGPMLVINDRISSVFTKGSRNINIRSGVGILSDKRVVFAITDDPDNFYNFAVFFKFNMNCKNALYLDGAISMMYLKDTKQDVTGGYFGPIISVLKK